ncbi:hypothetical protein LTR27_002856 [Elasticomyces elasticus]|nr:hypothetical protein LTR27_002856 [Elasticomyces elasticus]
MDGSPLQRIPAEIRVDIYERVLKQQTPVFVANETQRRMRYGSRLPANTLAITQTCKGMRHEIAQLFFTSNVFSITGPQLSAYQAAGTKRYGQHPFADLITAIGPVNAKVVGGVEIMLGEVISGHMMRRFCRQWGAEIGSYMDRLPSKIPQELSKRKVTASIKLNYGTEETQNRRAPRLISLPLDRLAASEALLEFAGEMEKEPAARAGVDDSRLPSLDLSRAAEELRRMSCTVREI